MSSAADHDYIDDYGDDFGDDVGDADYRCFHDQDCHCQESRPPVGSDPGIGQWLDGPAMDAMYGLRQIRDVPPAQLPAGMALQAILGAQRLASWAKAQGMYWTAALTRPGVAVPVSNLLDSIGHRADEQGRSCQIPDELIGRAAAGHSVFGDPEWDAVLASEAASFAEPELSAALLVAPITARRRIADAQELVDELPATFAALEQGRIEEVRARVIAEATHHVDPELRARAEQLILDRAKRGLSPGDLGRLAKKVVADVDPEAAGKRAETARARRGTNVRDLGDDMARFTADLAVEDAALTEALLDLLAAAVPAECRQGRGMSQLRADIFADLFGTLADTGLIDLRGINPTDNDPDPTEKDADPAATTDAPGAATDTASAETDPSDLTEADAAADSSPVEPDPDGADVDRDTDTDPADRDAADADRDPADAGPADAGPAESGDTDFSDTDTDTDADRDPADAGPAESGDTDFCDTDTDTDTDPANADRDPADAGPADAGPADAGSAESGDTDFSDTDTDTDTDPANADRDPADAGPAETDSAESGDTDFSDTDTSESDADASVETAASSAGPSVPDSSAAGLSEAGPAASAPGPVDRPAQPSDAGVEETGLDDSAEPEPEPNAADPGGTFRHAESAIADPAAEPPGPTAAELLARLRSIDWQSRLEPNCERRGGLLSMIRLPAGVRVNLDVTVALSTLAGCDDLSARLAGLGVITADTARALAKAAGTVRILVTNDPPGAPPHGPPPTNGSPPDRSSGSPDDAVAARRNNGGIHHDSPDCGTVLDFGRATYRPPATVIDRVDTRDQRCRFPGCPMVAERSDHDHRIAWDDGGATCPCDLDALCRFHHRAKTFTAWTAVRDQRNNTLTWTSPLGRVHVDRPAPDLPTGTPLNLADRPNRGHTCAAVAEPGDGDAPITASDRRDDGSGYETDRDPDDPPF